MMRLLLKRKLKRGWNSSLRWKFGALLLEVRKSLICWKFASLEVGLRPCWYGREGFYI